MGTPSQLQSAANKQNDIVIAHHDHGERTVIAIDFGPGVKPSLDIVDKTVIVATSDYQFRFNRPAKASEVTTNDGMLIIKG